MTYTVQSGDSLSRIASSYGVSVTDIVNANVASYPSLSTDPNAIQIGWQLQIPDNAPTTGPRTGGVTSAFPAPAQAPSDVQSSEGGSFLSDYKWYLVGAVVILGATYLMLKKKGPRKNPRRRKLKRKARRRARKAKPEQPATPPQASAS